MPATTTPPRLAGARTGDEPREPRGPRKPSSKQWWYVAHLLLEATGEPCPETRPAMSALISRLEASGAAPAPLTTDDLPF